MVWLYRTATCNGCMAIKLRSIKNDKTRKVCHWPSTISSLGATHGSSLYNVGPQGLRTYETNSNDPGRFGGYGNQALKEASIFVINSCQFLENARNEICNFCWASLYTNLKRFSTMLMPSRKRTQKPCKGTRLVPFSVRHAMAIEK